MRFSDRQDAGRRLAAELGRHRYENSVVFALPRGGGPVAFPMTQALHDPLTLTLTLLR